MSGLIPGRVPHWPRCNIHLFELHTNSPKFSSCLYHSYTSYTGPSSPACDVSNQPVGFGCLSHMAWMSGLIPGRVPHWPRCKIHLFELHTNSPKCSSCLHRSYTSHTGPSSPAGDASNHPMGFGCLSHLAWMGGPISGGSRTGWVGWALAGRASVGSVSYTKSGVGLLRIDFLACLIRTGWAKLVFYKSIYDLGQRVSWAHLMVDS
jgi:hypothetical protein